MPLGKDGYMNILEKNMPLGQRDTWSFWRKICWEYASGENGPNILVPLLLEKSQSQTTSLQICGMNKRFETPCLCVQLCFIKFKNQNKKNIYDNNFQESISLVTPDNIDSKMLTSLGSEKMAKKENGSQDPIGFHHFFSISSSSSYLFSVIIVVSWCRL